MYQQPLEDVFSFCAIISLPHSEARRTKTLESSPVTLELCEGVVGTALSSEEIAASFDVDRARRRYGREILPGEIGCTLAHLKAMRTFLSMTDASQPDALALIVEDDVEFLPNAAQTLGELAQQRHGYTLVVDVEHLIGQGDRATATAPISGRPGLHRVPPANLCTSAYIVSRATARLLVDRANKSRPSWTSDEGTIMAEEGIEIAIAATPAARLADVAATSTIGAASGSRASSNSSKGRGITSLIRKMGSRTVTLPPRISLHSALANRIWLSYYALIQRMTPAIRRSPVTRTLTSAVLFGVGALSFIARSVLAKRRSEGGC